VQRGLSAIAEHLVQFLTRKTLCLRCTGFVWCLSNTLQ